MDMANNYVLLYRFLRPCSLVWYVVDFDYFVKKKCFNIMWRDEYLLRCIVPYIIERKFNYLFIWHITCVDC